MKFIILTDTHLVPPGQSLYELDPAARLASAVDVINRDHDDIEFVIVTGDLVNRGEREAYRALHRALGALRFPVILMMGNHDRRDAFRSVFADADDDGNGFVQSVRSYPEATVITLDTLDETTHSYAGVLCERRLAFLETTLQAAPAHKPVLLFQHHPSLDVGLPSMDAIKLRDPDAQWDVFCRTRKPDFLFFGHVHRPIGGLWRGIPFRAQRAVNHQVAFDLTSPRTIPISLEAPDYALVTVKGRDIAILERSFLYDGPIFSLGSAVDASAEPSR